MRRTAWVLMFAGLASGQTFEPVLNWLPADTETILAAQGPFQIEDLSDDESATVPAFARTFALWLLDAAMGEVAARRTNGRVLEYALLAARRFRWPPAPALGLIANESCGVYALRESIAMPDGRVEVIAGHNVTIRSGAQYVSNKPVTFEHFLVALESGEWIACNNRDFLVTLLTRRSSGAARVALPPELPEWSQLDRSAPVWGLRHHTLSPGNDPTHPANDDLIEKATGLSVEFRELSVVPHFMPETVTYQGRSDEIGLQMMNLLGFAVLH